MLEIDTLLFHFINQDIANPVFDTVLPIMRSKVFWIPLYAFLIAFLFFNYKAKSAIIFICFLLINVGITDFTSSSIIKKNVKRTRPCNQLELQHQVRTLVRCGSGYSFTSSHATNHFGLAAFLILTLGKLIRLIRLPLFLWAAIIGFSQIYVGVHFPLDVLFGSLLGIIIGSIMAEIYNKWIKSSIYNSGFTYA